MNHSSLNTDRSPFINYCNVKFQKQPPNNKFNNIAFNNNPPQQGSQTFRKESNNYKNLKNPLNSSIKMNEDNQNELNKNYIVKINKINGKSKTKSKNEIDDFFTKKMKKICSKKSENFSQKGNNYTNTNSLIYNNMFISGSSNEISSNTNNDNVYNNSHLLKNKVLNYNNNVLNNNNSNLSFYHKINTYNHINFNNSKDFNKNRVHHTPMKMYLCNNNKLINNNMEIKHHNFNRDNINIESNTQRIKSNKETKKILAMNYYNRENNIRSAKDYPKFLAKYDNNNNKSGITIINKKINNMLNSFEMNGTKPENNKFNNTSYLKSNRINSDRNNKIKEKNNENTDTLHISDKNNSNHNGENINGLMKSIEGYLNKNNYEKINNYNINEPSSKKRSVSSININSNEYSKNNNIGKNISYNNYNISKNNNMLKINKDTLNVCLKLNQENKNFINNIKGLSGIMNNNNPKSKLSNIYKSTNLSSSSNSNNNPLTNRKKMEEYKSSSTKNIFLNDNDKIKYKLNQGLYNSRDEFYINRKGDNCNLY